MVAMNALPPVPAVFGDGWRDEWRRRVEHTPPWLLEWLNNPADGPTWRRGSIRLGPDGAGYERMACPTMLIVGWADGYRNNSFRVIEQYERNGLPWRLLAGPWVHKSPERARPGPNVDDDVDVLAFFDRHLRDGGATIARRAAVRCTSASRCDPSPTWRSIRAAGSTSTRGRRPNCATCVRHRTRRHRLARRRGRRRCRGVELVRRWRCRGGSRSTSAPTTPARSPTTGRSHEREELVGTAHVSLRVRSDHDYGHVSVKLCDVLPDGSSALITRGMLDLRHRGAGRPTHAARSGGRRQPLVPGEWIDVVIELEATTWTLEPGHTLRLAIAGTDWPNCWPPPGPLTLEVDAGAIELVLPIVDAARLDSTVSRPARARARRGGRRRVDDRSRRARPRDHGGDPLRRHVRRAARRDRHRRLPRRRSACRSQPRPRLGTRAQHVLDRVAGGPRPHGVDARGRVGRRLRSRSRSASASGTATTRSPTASGGRRSRVDGCNSVAPGRAVDLRSSDSHRRRREHDMGWMSDKQAETAARLRAVIDPRCRPARRCAARLRHQAQHVLRQVVRGRRDRSAPADPGDRPQVEAGRRARWSPRQARSRSATSSPKARSGRSVTRTRRSASRPRARTTS